MSSYGGGRGGGRGGRGDYGRGGGGYAGGGGYGGGGGARGGGGYGGGGGGRGGGGGGYGGGGRGGGGGGGGYGGGGGGGRGGGRGGRGGGEGSSLAHDMGRLNVRGPSPQATPCVPEDKDQPSWGPEWIPRFVAVPDPKEPRAKIVPFQRPESSAMALKTPRRPGTGTLGAACRVRVNHFLVHLAKEDLVIFQYDVAITPEVPSRGVNRAVITQLQVLYRASHLGGKQLAYDGRKNVFTAGPLPFESKGFVLKLPDKDETKSSKRDREFKVTLRLAKKTDPYHLQQFLSGKTLDCPQDAIQALDVVLRALASERHVAVARSLYFRDTNHHGSLTNGVECWRGYYQSLRPTLMGLSLNIDLSATSFYESKLVVDFARDYLNLRDGSRPLSPTDCAKLKRVLKGLRVVGTHRPGLSIQHRVTGITSLPASQLMFEELDGGKKSVADYFQEKYRIKLNYRLWPCLQSGNDKRPCFLPMEVCQIVPGQRYTKKLNEKQVQNMLKLTCRRPYDREQTINTMVKENKYDNDSLAQEFGIKVTNNPTTVVARVLDPPTLQYQGQQNNLMRPEMGKWNMIDKKMVKCGKVDYWAFLNLSVRTHPEDAMRFCESLVGFCEKIGMSFKKTPIYECWSPPPRNEPLRATLVKVAERCNDILKRNGQSAARLQLLIILLPDQITQYGNIKRICETELGIVSQCCNTGKAFKGGPCSNPQYLENVSLKINVKVGGCNTIVDAYSRKGIPFVTDVPTIIFGADVTHPQPGEDSSPSIAAVAASIDCPGMATYRCLLSAQAHRQEIISDLFKPGDAEKKIKPAGMIRELLLSFYRTSRVKPHRIIFYRDGVSEGQFSDVLLYEMDAIRKACLSLQDDYLPPVTFVIVQKRHHTRFFPASNMTDRSGNVLPGTIIDTDVCHPSEFDFYLCSHAGIQGTSRPTHYHVLFDENNFTADALQKLTNNLCYTFARCTRSVSVVPPAYYAHLAAFRARYYIETEYSDTASVSSGESRTVNAERVRQLPRVLDNVQDVMFFC